MAKLKSKLESLDLFDLWGLVCFSLAGIDVLVVVAAGLWVRFGPIPSWLWGFSGCIVSLILLLTVAAAIAGLVA